LTSGSSVSLAILDRPAAGHQHRRRAPATAATPSLTMGRVRFVVIGAVVGIAWAASLRGFMQA